MTIAPQALKVRWLFLLSQALTAPNATSDGCHTLRRYKGISLSFCSLFWAFLWPQALSTIYWLTPLYTDSVWATNVLYFMLLLWVCFCPIIRDQFTTEGTNFCTGLSLDKAHRSSSYTTQSDFHSIVHMNYSSRFLRYCFEFWGVRDY